MIKKVILSITILSATFMLGVLVSANGTYERVISYVVSNASIIFNDEKFDNSNPVITYDGRTYLSVRDVAAMTGAQLNWDNKNKVLTIEEHTQKNAVIDNSTNTSTEQESGIINDNIENPNSLVLANEYIDKGTSKLVKTPLGDINVDIYDFMVSQPSNKDKETYPNSKFQINYKIRVVPSSNYSADGIGIPFYFKFNNNNSFESIPLSLIPSTDGIYRFQNKENYFDISYLSFNEEIPKSYQLKTLSFTDDILGVWEWEF